MATAVAVAGLAAVVAPPPAHAAPPGAGQVEEGRTETSTTVRQPDGSRTVTLHAGPVRLREGARWRPVDLTLVAGPDGIVRPTAVAHDLALTPTGPVVHFAGGGSAALDRTTPLPAPRLTGHRATYPQAQPGHDLVVEATRSGFVASLRRTDPAAAPVPPLALRRDGRPAGAGEPLTGEALVETESAVSRVVAAAPPAGPAPVPFDTTVQTTVARTDLSGDPDLRLGTYDGTALARSLLTWDTAALAGQRVTAARLLVHQDWSASCAPRAWEVWSAPAAGPQTRWSTQPAADRMWATSTETRGHAACAGGWSAVDVTGLVRAWADAGAPAGGVQLRAGDERDPLGWKRFGSAEGPHVPHLEVTLA
ncbi:DNRLRE domain-containing protein [Pseudonocardia kunmingensis]|uniref:DNRLRE domain-containing protein n=1 Tax=Pseudonocardia kunmingensis TaxID=630975 RepID=UPI001150D490|nr:DNRLRE domain-containing protein [Pseudonocardia kunmingensis]